MAYLIKVNLIAFPQYETVVDALNSTDEFGSDDCTLQLLSAPESPVHVQVAFEINSAPAALPVDEQVRKQLVYAAFQVFAKSDVDILTISAVPLAVPASEPNCSYLGTFRSTHVIKRKSAIKIVDNYFNAKSFQELFDYHPIIDTWLPNRKFRIMQYDILDLVYGHLVK